MSAASTSVILRHIPPEILKEILLNLPVKSLLRFSAVSNSWGSMIFESRFVREHKNRATVNGGQRMVAIQHWRDYLSEACFFFRISEDSTKNPSLMAISEDSTNLICSSEGQVLRLRAFCDELWLVVVEYNDSLFLCNHSMRTHRKLPRSSYPRTSAFVFGLAYDSAADDYKVLKIARGESSPIKPELYSLKSDSWKTISLVPRMILEERCEFVNGAFYWIPIHSNHIVSFNLSTEQSGEIMLPATVLELNDEYEMKSVEVAVMRGKLCVSVNINLRHRWGDLSSELWVMEEYGVEKSWTKVFNIECHRLPLSQNCRALKPLCCNDNGDILFNASSRERNNLGLFMYSNKDAQLERVVARDGRPKIFGGFIYVESLVSPIPSGKDVLSSEDCSTDLLWRSGRSTTKVLGGSGGVAG